MNDWVFDDWKYSRDNNFLTIKPPEGEIIYLQEKIIEQMKKAARREHLADTFRLCRMAYELETKKEISNISYEDRIALNSIRSDGLAKFSNILNKFLGLSKEPIDYPILADQTAKDLQIVVDG